MDKNHLDKNHFVIIQCLKHFEQVWSIQVVYILRYMYTQKKIILSFAVMKTMVWYYIQCNIVPINLIYYFCHPQEAIGVVDSRAWPTLLDSDDLPKKKLTAIYKAPTPEMICYLDFSVSTTGMLAGVKVSKNI
jgi:hypothetical protein